MLGQLYPISDSCHLSRPLGNERGEYRTSTVLSSTRLREKDPQA